MLPSVSLPRVSLSLISWSSYSVVVAGPVKPITSFYHQIYPARLPVSGCMVIAGGQFLLGYRLPPVMWLCCDRLVVPVVPYVGQWLSSTSSLLSSHGHCNPSSHSFAACHAESKWSNKLRRCGHHGQRIKVDIMALAGEVTCKIPTPFQSWSK
jgi:hypothetical protein